VEEEPKLPERVQLALFGQDEGFTEDESDEEIEE
jgi:hypothetical protein